MFHFLEDVAPSGQLELMSLLPMLIIFVFVIYFMILRPENKRKKEAEKMRSELSVGDHITTIGGIKGVVVDVKEDKFVMETSADRVRIEFAMWGLSTNETAAEKAKEAQKKAEEAKAKKKADKKIKK